MQPILMSKPHEDVAPHAYVVVVTRTHCTHCATTHESAQVFAKTHMRSQHGHKYVTNLRPVGHPNEITWNLPIETQLRPVERLPFCHECSDSVSLAHLPQPPKPTAEQAARVLVGLMGHDEKPKAAKTPPKPFTIDDL